MTDTLLLDTHIALWRQRRQPPALVNPCSDRRLLAGRRTSPSAMTETAQDFQNAQSNRQQPSARRRWLPGLGSGVQPGRPAGDDWVPRQHGMGAGPVGFVTLRKNLNAGRAQARHPGIGRCRPFPGASLLRRSGSLLGRFNSLIGRLGNLPWFSGTTMAWWRGFDPRTARNRVFASFFPPRRDWPGPANCAIDPSVPPGQNPRPGANSRQRLRRPTFAAPGQKPRSVAKAAASLRARRSVPSRKIDSAPIAVVA